MPTDDTMNEDQALLAELIAQLQLVGSTIADAAPINEVLRATIEHISSTETPVTASASSELAGWRVKAAALPDIEARVKVLQDERKAGRVDELVSAELKRGTIGPGNDKLIQAARNLAQTDESHFRLVFGAMDPIHHVPSSGGRPRSNRAKIIAASAAEFDRDNVAACGASKPFYIDADLAAAGEPTITNVEIQKLG